MAALDFRRGLVSLVDLMAAVPSVVYGLFGAVFLQWNALAVLRWLTVNLGWIPFLGVDGFDPHDRSAPTRCSPVRRSSRE